jgi:hypothetical protein
MSRAVSGALLGFWALAACIPVGSFACDEDSQCGVEGVCEASGHCSNVDDACPSRRRYSRYAPAEIADRCVVTESEGSTGVGDGTMLTSASSSGDDGTTFAGPVRSDVGGASSGDGGPNSACLPDGRAAIEPVLLYDFCAGDGATVPSITGTPFALELENGAIGSGFAWVDDGLFVDGEHTALRSFEPVFDRLDACVASSEVTLETWITPASESQGGPTVIAAIGASSSSQSGTNIALRMNPEWDVPGWIATVRTSEDGDDGRDFEWLGIPLLRATHLVLVHGDAEDTLWVDGEIRASQAHPGDLTPWNPNFDLVLGNRPDYDVRNWAGTYHMVAIYCEALTPDAIATNFAAGHRSPG